MTEHVISETLTTPNVLSMGNKRNPHLLLERNAKRYSHFGQLSGFVHNRILSLYNIVKSMVFPVMMKGCESCTIKKA